jgi:hypothetical protein
MSDFLKLTTPGGAKLILRISNIDSVATLGYNETKVNIKGDSYYIVRESPDEIYFELTGRGGLK